MTAAMSPMLPSSVELGEIVEQVWSSFLGGEIVSMPGDVNGRPYQGQVVASVSISGEWAGHLMVMTGQQCAHHIAGAMFEMDVAEVTTAEVADALGEIANMVGGSVKSMVGVEATMSLPQVVLDASALVSPDATKLVCVSAQWNGEPLEVSVWERSQATAMAGMGQGV